MAGQERWCIDAGRVMWEELDGETVIVDLSSGRYHAASGTALSIWSALAAGATVEEIIGALRVRHPRTPDDAEAAVTAFIGELVGAGLVIADPQGPHDPPDPTPSAPAQLRQDDTSGGDPWQPPRLESYDDLEDLLLLDPVHDVSVQGWPQVQPPA